ncbi:SAM-dependent methyltransferase [Neorhizobium galegae]|uniref:class I SAM-dependent methyltransferase n=1 Tax=Neorhizobium galegae TaxID=399 RepID=UPI001AE5BABB|nr:class I SAM-dependent methyltransferase [Neorhizobium galegae]MBP2550638.1 SAM-dependent methyltransferase [Neorhizobium galegae]
MSGFDAKWLRLREPVDGLARDVALVDAFSRYVADRAPPATVLDIGCGTGSTYRSLSQHLPAGTNWRLLDYDPSLLAAAEKQLGTDGIEFVRHDLNQPDGMPLDGVAIVTASAFFDLGSAAFCDRLLGVLAARRIGLYAALNYDGRVEWQRPHPLDQRVVADFNRHQLTDKGLGPALGPNATEHLRTKLDALSYDVSIAPSVWRIGRDEADLHIAFLRGLVDPVLEIGTLQPEEIGEWMAFRLAYVRGERGGCEVGHHDLLALPRD